MNDSLASKVARARDAADRAVGVCDAARDDAIREAGLVDAAGDDVDRRDAAALAAGDAALRCDTASSAALEAAACCEAVAEEAVANNLANLHGVAEFAAQQARAAAARCDSDGAAVAASRAANAIADCCVAACVDAAALSMAAREAAARCVHAHDDARTAEWVVEQDARRSALARHCNVVATVFIFLTSRYDDKAQRKAARQSDVAHKHARTCVSAAALAARKASVRCAAASRRGASTASIARKIASRCEQMGGDVATAAAAAAREAADRCVAECALDIDSAAPLVDPAVPRAVPLADAAALEARKAAASCDAALADSAGDADINNMRGWLMMVATLFVGIAFQAILQRPPTMSSQDSSPKAVSGSASPAPAPATTTDNATSLTEWSNLNELTMFSSLWLLVVLMIMKSGKSKVTLCVIRGLLILIAFSVGCSFSVATTTDPTSTLIYLIGLGIITSIGYFFPVINFCVNPSSDVF